MNPSSVEAAAGSRDSHLTLRRVERQQHLIEKLHASAHRITLGALAAEFGVAERTIARDLERLRLSGVPIDIVAGRGGGAIIHRIGPIAPISFDLPEIGALMSSLVSLGPTASESAAAAMRKLTNALTVEMAPAGTASEIAEPLPGSCPSGAKGR